MAGRVADAVVLSEEERRFLNGQVPRHETPRSFSDRCRMILWCADGLSSKEVVAQLGVHEHTVGKWRRRFVKDRIEGLTDEYRPGRPRTVSDEQVAEVIERTLNGETWSAQPMRSSSGRLQAPNAEACHPLVDPLDGRRDGTVAHHHRPPLDRLRTSAAPERDVQALDRSHCPAGDLHRKSAERGCRGQGAGHRGVVPVTCEPAARQGFAQQGPKRGYRLVCRREIPNPGAGSRTTGAAAGAGCRRAENP